MTDFGDTKNIVYFKEIGNSNKLISNHNKEAYRNGDCEWRVHYFGLGWHCIIFLAVSYALSNYLVSIFSLWISLRMTSSRALSHSLLSRMVGVDFSVVCCVLTSQFIVLYLRAYLYLFLNVKLSFVPITILVLN